MEKNKKLLIGGSVIIVVLIAIVIIARLFPPAGEEDTSGTIGKVEKFRKNQLTAKDVLLSDDLLKDTVALRNTIGEIGQFATFSIEMSVLINGYWLPEINSNWQTDEGKEVSKNLSDFASFIDNNVEKTAATQNVLYNLYLKKEKSGTEDVGSKLANFVNYVLQMMERDSVMENTITRLNNYIASNPQVKGNLSKQLKKLQSLRDKIIVDTFLYGTVVGDKKKSDFAAEQKLNAVELGTIDLTLGTGFTSAISSVQMVVLERAAALNFVIPGSYSLGVEPPVVNSKAGTGILPLELASNVLEFVQSKEIGFVDVVESIPYCSAANNLSFVFAGNSALNNKLVGSVSLGSLMNSKEAIGIVYYTSQVSLLSSHGPSILNKDVLGLIVF